MNQVEFDSTLSAKYALDTKRFGFWIFLAMEMMFFGGLFFLYFNERYAYPKAFAYGSHLLDLKLGTLNTAVLLTSSFFMALALHFLKKNIRLGAVLCLLGTVLLGVLFLIVKMIELNQDDANALLPGLHYVQPSGAPQQEELFQSLYLLAIGLHALHLIIGLFWASAVMFFVSRAPQIRVWQARGEALGLYWHFVDVIWIFLFPLFYLVGPLK